MQCEFLWNFHQPNIIVVIKESSLQVTQIDRSCQFLEVINLKDLANLISGQVHTILDTNYNLT